MFLLTPLTILLSIALTTAAAPTATIIGGNTHNDPTTVSSQPFNPAAVPPPAPTLPGTAGKCTTWHVAKAGDSFPHAVLSASTFLKLNPAVSAQDLGSLKQGYAYCLADDGTPLPQLPSGSRLKGRAPHGLFDECSDQPGCSYGGWDGVVVYCNCPQPHQQGYSSSNRGPIPGR